MFNYSRYEVKQFGINPDMMKSKKKKALLKIGIIPHNCIWECDGDHRLQTFS
jgi:hypothetical protein